MANDVNIGRRNLFRRNKTAAVRPPWVRADIEFTDQCSRCNKCIESCETQIIVKGSGGFAELDFSKGECTFCGKCADVCPDNVFTSTRAQPAWPLRAHINSSCLVHQGVMCQNCKDSCDYDAITFPPSLGQPPLPKVAFDSCNGCGACVAPCPNQSIRIDTPPSTK